MAHTPSEGTERTTVTLPRALAAELRVRARASGQPVSALVRDAVERFLKGKESAGLPAFTGVGASGDRHGSVKAEQLLRRRARRNRR
jgi:Ribbon-helix-helix protein, copG family